MSLRTKASNLRKRVVSKGRYLAATTVSSCFAARPGTAIATHLPVLMGVAALVRPRTVLELGSGYFSTPMLLSRDCVPTLQTLCSVEDDPEWVDRMSDALAGDDRLTIEQVRSVPGWLRDADLSPYDLIFIDDSKAVETRIQSLRAVCERARADAVIVMHDFELRSYQANVGPGWRRFVFTTWRPQTGVMWREGAGLERRRLEALLRVLDANRGADPADVTRWPALLR